MLKRLRFQAALAALVFAQAAVAQSGSATGTLLDTLSIPNDRPVKVASKVVLESGRWYVLEASGVVSDWSHVKDGVDPVWCYAEWRCGKAGEAWNQLRIDDKGLTDIAGTPVPYNAQHEYRVRIQGQGKPIVAYASDAQGSWQDNSGAFTLRIYAEGSAAITLLDTLSIPNDKPVKVPSKVVLENGRWYLLEASGVVSDWSHVKDGVDAVWCYAEWRCGKAGEAWNQLRIDDKGLTDIAGAPVPYNPQHEYRVRILGQGKPIVAYAWDAQGSWQDNSGAFVLKIYAEGSAAAANSPAGTGRAYTAQPRGSAAALSQPAPGKSETPPDERIKKGLQDALKGLFGR